MKKMNLKLISTLIMTCILLLQITLPICADIPELLDINANTFTAEKDDSQQRGYDSNTRQKYYNGIFIYEDAGIYKNHPVEASNPLFLRNIKTPVTLYFNPPHKEGYEYIGLYVEIVHYYKNGTTEIEEQKLGPEVGELEIKHKYDGANRISLNATSIYQNSKEVAIEKLGTCIQEAQKLHDLAQEGTLIGEYVSGSKEVFQNAINSARVVSDDTTSSETELKDALNLLLSAQKDFESKKKKEAKKTYLANLIIEYQQLHDSAVEGSEPNQYQEGSKDIFNYKILQGKIVYQDPYATPEQVRQKELDLESAKNEFKKAKNKEPDDGIDQDKDTISDKIEKSGFVIADSSIKPWNEDTTIKYYKTNPLSFSTTGDPYGDQMKTLGIGMDHNVMEPQRTNPYIAAYPNVKVRMLEYHVTPINTIEDTDGGSQSNEYTNEVANTDEQTHTGSVSVMTGMTAKVTTNPFSLYEHEVTVEVTAGYEGSRNWGTTTTTSNSNSKIKNWEKAITLSTDKAAKLEFIMEYINYGSAPMKNVQVKFNVKIGNKIIATVGANKDDNVPVANFLATALQPEKQTYGPINVSKNNTEDIYVSLDELKAIQMGAPITIEPVEIKGSVMRYDLDKRDWIEAGDWDAYKSQIEGRTATLIFQGKNGTNKEYKVAAKSSFYDPHMTLLNALAYTVGLKTIDNKLHIKDKPFGDGWGLYFSNMDKVMNQLDELTAKGQGFFDIELEAGQTVIVNEPKDNPNPSINLARFSEDNSRIYANVSSGDYRVESVIAKIMINDNEVNVPLERDITGSLYYNSTSLSGIINAYSSAKLIVKDAKDNVVEKEIDPGKEKDGLKYVPLTTPKDLLPLHSTKNVTNNTYAASLADFPDAEALVVQVESNRWSSHGINVKVGQMETNLGTYDYRDRVYKLLITDKFGTVHTVYGGNEPYNMSPPLIITEDIGIPKHSIVKMEILGDPHFKVVALAYDDEGGGPGAWYFGANEESNVLDGNIQTDALHRVSTFYVQDVKGQISDNVEYLSSRTLILSKNSPIVSKTLVVPREGNTLNIEWNISDSSFRRLNNKTIDADIKVKVLGYYTKKGGYKFTQVNQSPFIYTGLESKTTQMPGIPKAKAYLIEVRNHRISSDKVAVTLNGITHNLGASDGKLFPIDESVFNDSIHKSPVRSDIMFIPANSDPNIIALSTEISDWKTSSGEPKIEVRILGYFSDFGNLVYESFSIENLVYSDDSDGSNVTVALPTYEEKPKAYLIDYKSDTARKASMIRRSIGDVNIDVGISSHEPAYFDFPDRMYQGTKNNTTAYIPVTSDNPYNLVLSGYIEGVSRHYEELRILGYFY